MTSYVRVTETLVSDGYLSEADTEAASAVLAEKLMVEEVAEIAAESIVDLAVEEKLIEEATDLAAEAAKMGDPETEAIAKEAIEGALDTTAMDVEVIETAEAVIDAAYLDAAAALVEAELIAEADKEAAAASIERAMKMG